VRDVRRAAPPARRARVAWVVGGVGLALLLAGRFAAVAQRGPPRRSSLEVRVWDFPNAPGGATRAVVMLPRGRTSAQRFPLLVALHGLGETLRGVERGAWAWPRDYELGASDFALRRGRLDVGAFLGHVAPARLDELRAELRRQAYRGLVVVAPFTPDVRADLGGAAHQAYDAWLAGALVARARSELPVLATREATGIDGVSLGGLHALWTGLGHPETFGAVGALQPAVRDRQDRVVARYVVPTGGARPAQRLRVVTSSGDTLRPDVLAFVDALRTRAVPHEFRDLVGPHDYAFNRGPGGVEMLLFHDRALRGEACP
jgi:hypothetical protein